MNRRSLRDRESWRGKLNVWTLPDADVLGDGAIEVPETGRTDLSGGSTTRVETEDTGAEFVVDLDWVGEHIDSASTIGRVGIDAYSVRIGVHGDGPGVQVVGDVGAGPVDLNNARAHEVCRYGGIPDLRFGEAEAIVVEEEIGLSAQHLRQDRADRYAEAVVVGDG